MVWKLQCPSLYACRILYVFSQYLSGLFIGFVTSYCLLCSVLVVLFGCLSKVWIMVLNTVSCDSSFINCSWQYYWWFLWELWHMVSKDTLLKVNFTFEKYNILSIFFYQKVTNCFEWCLGLTEALSTESAVVELVVHVGDQVHS